MSVGGWRWGPRGSGEGAGARAGVCGLRPGAWGALGRVRGVGRGLSGGHGGPGAVG